MSWMEDLREFLRMCAHVLKAARKPSKEEYLESAKIAGTGILIVGGVGFIIRIIVQLIQLYG